MNYDHLVCSGATYDTLGWSYERTVQKLRMSGRIYMLCIFRVHVKVSCDCIRLAEL
jgi:hypothetical protein